MPLRDRNPFDDHTANLRASVNPYVFAMQQALEENPELAVAQSILHGPKLKGKKGHWRQALNLPDDTPLLVEIGCHKGKNLLELSQYLPNAHCLGIDITIKRVVTTAQRAVDQNLKNVHTVFANAKSLDLLFAPGEVDGFLIFYPDPWLKRSKAKNRLITEPFVANLSNCLKPGGFCWFKTDQESYFELGAKLMEDQGMTRQNVPEGLENALTESIFEGRFRRQGIPGWSGFFKKIN